MAGVIRILDKVGEDLDPVGFRRALVASKEIADEMTDRLDVLRGIANSVNRSLETGEHAAVSDAVVALRGLGAEVTRIMVDVHVCTWSDAPKAKKRKA
jgi:hypothetical protein